MRAPEKLNDNTKNVIVWLSTALHASDVRRIKYSSLSNYYLRSCSSVINLLPGIRSTFLQFSTSLIENFLTNHLIASLQKDDFTVLGSLLRIDHQPLKGLARLGYRRSFGKLQSQGSTIKTRQLTAGTLLGNVQHEETLLIGY